MRDDKVIYVSDLMDKLVDDFSIDGPTLRKVKQHIDDTTAVDVVVHGRWNFDEECWTYNCSNCRRATGISRIFSYCPHCGAKMDGDVNG